MGEEFQRVYTIVKQQELDEYDKQITPLEYNTGF
jgi:glutamine synthetase